MGAGVSLKSFLIMTHCDLPPEGTQRSSMAVTVPETEACTGEHRPSPSPIYLPHEHGVAHGHQRLAGCAYVLEHGYDYSLRGRYRYRRAAARHVLVPIRVDAAAKQLFHIFTSQ